MKLLQKQNHTIYGLNNCLSFLVNKNKFIVNSIYVNINSPAYKNTKILKYINRNKEVITLLDNNNFSKKYPHKHTQGIVLNFTGTIEKDIEEIKEFEENSCLLIADQINDPQNLGQMIRTSECAGVDGIILPKHNSVHLTDTVLQVSQGAFLYMDIIIENNLNNTIKYLKTKGFWVVGLENSIEAQNWYEIDYKGKIAIVLGSEGTGIRKLVKESCDFLATIPMEGKTNSLNVSAALSAILFERQRQLKII